ncbi:MAG: fumarate hydratase [Peptococcaceae bacterium]|nr:fumarate hydratase [Peptococcaceae bacterium]
MKSIHVNDIINTVANLCVEVNCCLGDDVVRVLREAYEKESAELGRDALAQILENAEIARRERLPICQDTGLAVFFVEVGQDVLIEGGNLEEALHEGVRRGYRQGYLRSSVVDDPFVRRNTGDNTPAVIHMNVCDGNLLKITFMPKGAGSENMSGLRMLSPSDGLEGVMDFVVETVAQAGGNPCPPIIVGVGAGGSMEKACLLAKQALLRDVGQANSEPRLAEIEKELLRRINGLGIGPAGYGGRVTALAVHLDVFPTHIAMLPVAVNINCHAVRHGEVIL